MRNRRRTRLLFDLIDPCVQLGLVYLADDVQIQDSVLLHLTLTNLALDGLNLSHDFRAAVRLVF